MKYRADAPDDNRKRKTFFRPDLVHHIADKKQSDRISRLERENNPSVIDFRPAEFRREGRFQNPDHLPVNIINRRRKKKQSTNYPALSSDFRRDTIVNRRRDRRFKRA